MSYLARARPMVGLPGKGKQAGLQLNGSLGGTVNAFMVSLSILIARLVALFHRAC